MGNFRQHVNRKRKERERKRNRKNAKHKFKGEHGNDSLKTIANASQKSLLISPPPKEAQGALGVPRDSDNRQDSSPGSAKSSCGVNSAPLKTSKPLMSVEKVSGTRKASPEKKASLKTAMKANDSSTAQPRARNLLRKKKTRCRIKAEMERLQEKHFEFAHGNGREITYDSSENEDGESSSPKCPLAKIMGDLEMPSEKNSDDEEEIDVVGMCATPTFMTGAASKALKKMRVAQFRIINEMLYTSQSDKAVELFEEDRGNFYVYHEGYRHQVKKWLMNPIDRIISKIKTTFPNTTRIADLGCGEAKLAMTLKPQGYTVHSFDLVAANEHVRACNIRDVPLDAESVDVAVLCLSLMGTDMGRFVLEANRILVADGELIIAEVESRIPSVDAFVKVMKRYGFSLRQKETARVFLFFSFRKSKAMPKGAEKNMDNVLWLKPCLYKKR